MPGKAELTKWTERNYNGSKFGFRGANGVRARGGPSENFNTNCGVSGKRSPRRAGGINNNRPVFSARHHGGATFGTDITNITGKMDRFKPLKQLPQPQPSEPLVTTSPPVTEGPAVDSIIEIRNAQDADEYVADIIDHLFQNEVAFMPRAHYMDTQADLTPKMRMILMDWLVEVHTKYKLRSETLHLTVNLIDRHLSQKQVSRKRLQLVGVVAMFIASKFEEISPPEIDDWVYITDKAYTKDDVLNMEVNMLMTLGFQVAVPTAAHFFPCLQKANGCNPVHRALAQYILELGLLDIRMLQHAPSHIVSAALLLSNELFGRCPAWPQHMVEKSYHTEASLRSCVEVMKQNLEAEQAGAGGQLQAVWKKFSTAEYHVVAKMKF